MELSGKRRRLYAEGSGHGGLAVQTAPDRRSSVTLKRKAAIIATAAISASAFDLWRCFLLIPPVPLFLLLVLDGGAIVGDPVARGGRGENFIILRLERMGILGHVNNIDGLSGLGCELVIYLLAAVMRAFHFAECIGECWHCETK